MGFIVIGSGGGGGGGGDLSGPGISTDGGLPVFNGVTGTLLAQSNLEVIADELRPTVDGAANLGSAGTSWGTFFLKDGLNFGDGLLVMLNDSDRTRIQADTIEIYDSTGVDQYLYLADRQVTLVQKNLYFEDMNHGVGFGDVWWDQHNTGEVGYSKREESISAGTGPGAPKTYWVGTDLKFDFDGTGTHNGRIRFNNAAAGTVNADQLAIRSLDDTNEYLTANASTLTVKANVLIQNNGTPAGHLYWFGNNSSDIGSIDAGSTRKGPRNIYLGNALYIGSGSNRIEQSSSTRTQLKGDQWDMYSSNGTYYVEHLLNVSGTHLIQTNCNYRLNSGALLMADVNGTNDGADIGTLTASRPTNVHVKTKLTVNGNQVVQTRETGWTAATGTATKGGFDTSTALPAEIAESLKAVIDALIAHGLIGA